jgi:Helix-turn-helix domain
MNVQRDRRALLLERLGIVEAVTVGTDEAAAIVDRSKETLRRWACSEDPPVKPRRVGRRLRWLVADLQRYVNGEQPSSPT